MRLFTEWHAQGETFVKVTGGSAEPGSPSNRCNINKQNDGEVIKSHLKEM